MTWKELKGMIEKIPEDRQNDDLLILSEDSTFCDALLSTAIENAYFNKSWYSYVDESDLTQEEIEEEGTYLALKKGYYYLSIY